MGVLYWLTHPNQLRSVIQWYASEFCYSRYCF